MLTQLRLPRLGSGSSGQHESNSKHAKPRRIELFVCTSARRLHRRFFKGSGVLSQWRQA